MKVQDIIDRANRLVTSEQYVQYCEGFPRPMERAIVQSGYDGISTVTTGNVKRFMSYVNGFWMYLPDSPLIRYGAFFEICNFCEMSLYECEDYEEVFQ